MNDIDPDSLFDELEKLDVPRLVDFFLNALNCRLSKRDIYAHFLQLLDNEDLNRELGKFINMPTLVHHVSLGLLSKDTYNLINKMLTHSKIQLSHGPASHSSDVYFAIVKDDVDWLNRQVASANPSFNWNQNLSFQTNTIIGQDSLTILALAALFCSIRCFKYLLLNGSQADANALYYAVAGGDQEIIQLLLESNIEITQLTEAAVIFNQNDILAWLIDVREQPVTEALTNRNSAYLIHFTTRDGNIRGTELLIEHGANPSSALVQTQATIQPVDFCVARNDIVMTEYLIEHGGQPSSSSFAVAVFRNYRPLLELLISRGVDTNDGVAREAICIAASSGSVEVAQFLIDNNFDLNTCDSKNDTPAIIAARHGHPEMLAFMFEHGCVVDAVGENKNTALHHAAHRGDFEMTEWLLDHAVNIDARNESGQTPLHLAAEMGRMEVAKLLVQKGASKDKVDKYGRTPSRTALESDYQDLSRFLNYYSFDDCIVQ